MAEDLADRARAKWTQIRARQDQFIQRSRGSLEALLTHTESSPWKLLHRQFDEVMKLHSASDKWGVLMEGDASCRALLSAHHPLGVLHANAIEIFEARMQTLEQRMWVDEATQLVELLRKCTLAASGSPSDRRVRANVLRSVERATFCGASAEPAEVLPEPAQPPASALPPPLLLCLLPAEEEASAAAKAAAKKVVPSDGTAGRTATDAIRAAPRFYFHAYAAISVGLVDKDMAFRRRQNELQSWREAQAALAAQAAQAQARAQAQAQAARCAAAAAAREDENEVATGALPSVTATANAFTALANAVTALVATGPWLRCLVEAPGATGSAQAAGVAEDELPKVDDVAVTARRALSQLRTALAPTDKLDCISRAVTALAAAGSATAGATADDVLSALVVVLLESEVRSPHADAAFIAAFAHEGIDFAGASGFCFSCFEAAAEAAATIALAALLDVPADAAAISVPPEAIAGTVRWANANLTGSTAPSAAMAKEDAAPPSPSATRSTLQDSLIAMDLDACMDQLAAMGFDESQVVVALADHGGNRERALDSLLGCLSAAPPRPSSDCQGGGNGGGNGGVGTVAGDGRPASCVSPAQVSSGSAAAPPRASPTLPSVRRSPKAAPTAASPHRPRASSDAALLRSPRARGEARGRARGRGGSTSRKQHEQAFVGSTALGAWACELAVHASFSSDAEKLLAAAAAVAGKEEEEEEEEKEDMVKEEEEDEEIILLLPGCVLSDPVCSSAHRDLYDRTSTGTTTPMSTPAASITASFGQPQPPPPARAISAPSAGTHSAIAGSSAAPALLRHRHRNTAGRPATARPRTMLPAMPPPAAMPPQPSTPATKCGGSAHGPHGRVEEFTPLEDFTRLPWRRGSSGRVEERPILPEHWPADFWAPPNVPDDGDSPRTISPRRQVSEDRRALALKWMMMT
jgi:hypothetical protein